MIIFNLKINRSPFETLTTIECGYRVIRGWTWFSTAKSFEHEDLQEKFFAPAIYGTGTGLRTFKTQHTHST